MYYLGFEEAGAGRRARLSHRHISNNHPHFTERDSDRNDVVYANMAAAAKVAAAIEPPLDKSFTWSHGTIQPLGQRPTVGQRHFDRHIRTC